MWRHLATSFLVMTLTVAAITVSTYSAFTATATVSGINFSTGNASLNLFGNLGYTNAGNNGNLTPVLPGMAFRDIGPNWTRDYLLKYFNNGTTDLMTSLTVVSSSDPANLSNHLWVEVWLWNDVDGNGAQGGGDTFTKLSDFQTLESLKTNAVQLGQLNRQQPRGLRLRFKTEDMPSATQNQQAVFNFLIDGTTDGVTATP